MSISNWWGRVMLSLRTGLAAYNGKTLAPRLEWGYDDYGARLSRYAVLSAYADGTVYSSVQPFAETLKATHRLYRWVRDTHSPVKIALDLIAANVYQGTVDHEHLTGGALPFQFNNRALEGPLRLLLRWSNLSQQLDPYVRTAALLGDAAWWVVDDPDRKRVRLELLNIAWLKEKVTDEVGNVRAAVIEYETEDDPDIAGYQPQRGSADGPKRDTYLYTKKVYRPQRGDLMTENERGVRFETFKDGQPWDYLNNVPDGEYAGWTAPYDVVPLKVAPFERGPGEWGKSAFYASLGKINEINDAQSLLNDTVRRVIEPILVAENIALRDDSKVQTVRDERTGIITLYIQSGSKEMPAKLTALTLPIDVDAAGRNIDRLEAALERDLPVMALQRMRDKGERITAPGVQAGYSDAIGQIQMARRNLDPGLVMALQIGVTIGATRRYPGFEAFNADSYDAGEMDVYLKERPVVADNLTKQDYLTQLATVKDQPPAIQSLMLEALGVPQASREAVLNEARAQLNADVEAILSGIDNGNANGNQQPPDAAL